MNDFPGGKRSRVVTFSVDGKGYAGGGISDDETGTPLPDFSDFWEYNPETDHWTQMKDMPYWVNGQAVGVINNKAYTVSFGGELTEYDPTTDKWTLKKSMPGKRGDVCAISLNGKIYAGLGMAIQGNEMYNDWWEYGPETDVWRPKADLPAPGRGGAAGWSTADRGYVGFGWGDNGAFYDFWEYDPGNDSWIERSAPTRSVSSGITFTIDDKPYSGCPTSDANHFSELRQYDPALDKWTLTNNFPSGYCMETGSFTIGNAAYIIGGTWSGFSEQVWKFD